MELRDMLGREVKVRFLDEGRTKIVRGILSEVKENYIVINDILIGLGQNFISCNLVNHPKEGT